MPILNGVGYSTATCIKQTLFTRIIRQHIFIASKVIQKNKNWCSPFYHYFDINAGNGYNQELGLYGSPLYFANEIIKFRQSCKALFIEKNEENANSLLLTLHDWIKERSDSILDNAGAILDLNGFSYQFLLENNDFYDVKIESQKPMYGLLYHDPNGIWDAEYLQKVSKKHKYLDLLINCNSTSFKRCHAAYKKDSLLESLLRIKKSSWLISKPRGKMQWCFLMGANINEKCFSSDSELGLVPIKSTLGQEYWEQVSLEKSVIKEQKEIPLFELPKSYPKTYPEYLKTEQFRTLRQKRFEFAGGICEVCKEKECKDVHHICYVDWRKGEIDSFANIVMLCRSCHQQIHNHSSLPDYDIQYSY